MTRVILYCRVSSDEQRNERLSVEYQERALRHHCERHGFEIIGEPYRDDFSAKDYDLKRPEFKKMYEYCKAHQGEVDKVLFLRWDRFSRNLEFASTYKRRFIDALGIEINSIEEPIDFNSTDWPMWLALRCGVAHTEDNKISRRTQEGNHEHLMRGEWCGKAPRGYKNVKANEEAGTDHYIAIDPTTAPIVKKVFEEVAEGVEAPASIRRKYLPNASKTSFFNMLRNRFYIGRIQVPAFLDYPACEVQGRHEPLIDEETFNTVQDVMNGKRKKTPKLSGKANKPNLYLRKFLTCPICGHRITGATSKGNGGRYDYYLCNHDHKHLNVRAEKVNESFRHYVANLVPNDAFSEIYREMLADARKSMTISNKGEIEKLQQEIAKLNQRTDKVYDDYFDGKLSMSDRDELTTRYKGAIQELETRIKFLKADESLRIKEKVEYSMTIVENLPSFLSTASAETKVRILGSIFPEGIEFDGEKYRTKSINSALEYIYQNSSVLYGEMETDPPDLSGKSAFVVPTGIEPVFKV